MFGRVVFLLFAIGFAQTAHADWVATTNWSAGQPFDTSQWVFERGLIRNWEAQYYTGRTSGNFQDSPSGINIVARKQTVPNVAYRKNSRDWRQSSLQAQYTSASIVSVKAWQNVKIEVVASVHTGKGAWPAIWLKSPNSQGFAEIDVMEHVGREPQNVYSTVHFGSAWKPQTKSAQRAIPQFQGKEVIYSLELSPAILKINIDGEPMLEMDRRIAVGNVQPLQQPFNLILNLALGGSWSGPIDDIALPSVMTIKAIRIWEWRGPMATSDEGHKSLQ